MIHSTVRLSGIPREIVNSLGRSGSQPSYVALSLIKIESCVKMCVDCVEFLWVYVLSDPRGSFFEVWGEKLCGSQVFS